jgi:hypothetical protein
MSTLLLGSSNWQRLMTPADVEAEDEPGRDTDVDGYSEMLSVACVNHANVTLPYIRSDRDSIERWADAAKPAELVAGLMHPSADVRSMAATYLRDLWMDAA